MRCSWQWAECHCRSRTYLVRISPPSSPSIMVVASHVLFQFMQSLTSTLDSLMLWLASVGKQGNNFMHEWMHSFALIGEVHVYYSKKPANDRTVSIQMEELAELSARDGCTVQHTMDDNFISHCMGCSEHQGFYSRLECPVNHAWILRASRPDCTLLCGRSIA